MTTRMMDGTANLPLVHKGNKSNYRSNPYSESSLGKGKGKGIRPPVSQDDEMVSSARPTLPALFATNELCYDSKELHGLTFNKKLKRP